MEINLYYGGKGVHFIYAADSKTCAQLCWSELYEVQVELSTRPMLSILPQGKGKIYHIRKKLLPLPAKMKKLMKGWKILYFF